MTAGVSAQAALASTEDERLQEDAHASLSERQVDHLQSLTDASLGYMSLEQTLSELLERIRAALGADTAAVLLLDEDRGVLVARAARGLEEEVRQGVQIPLARGFAGRVAAEARPIVIEDLSRAEVVNPILRQRGIRSMLGVPLQVEEHVIGVMHVGTLRQRLFDQDDVKLLQLAAGRVARAIDAARLAEQRAVTEIMQRTLLPDALPQIAELRLSAKYLPAGSGVKIGGDWYDVVRLGVDRMVFVIGDVVGRGVIAASVMAEIRTALRAYLVEGHELADVIALLNDLLVSMGRSRGATAAILELDLELEQLASVSAGHLPALLISPDGASRFLEPTPGLPLGIRAGQRYARQCDPFPLGSVLLLYTDGLVEKRGEPIDVGLARLQAAARKAVAGTDSSFADEIYRDLLQEASLDDDIALLAIESRPLGSKLELTLDAHPGVLAGLRSTVGRWLGALNASEDEQFDVALSVSEAAGNAIEHAYGASLASFTVLCECESQEVRIVVGDQGRWRRSRQHGRGRGLMIMRALMDTVEVARSERGTTVTMTKRLGARS